MIPKPLLEDIVNGKCLPFIGAGFSLNAALPSGKKRVIGITKKNSADTLKNTFHLWGIMVTICKIAILTYPHETFGRYPEEIKGKTTEEIYQSKLDILKPDTFLITWQRALRS